MKRYIFILAAFAITLASCSKIYDATPVNTDPTPIGFGAWTEVLTKAARVPGTSTFTASGYQENDLAVYGYKHRASGAPTDVTVFDDVVVSTTNGTTWTYSPKRFWDTGYDSYIFYAVSPAAVGTEGTVDPQTGEITSASITFAGNNNDILVADKKTVLKTDTPVNFGNGSVAYGAVNLVFNHIASLVDLKVKKSTDLNDATVAVTAIALENINKVNNFTVSDAYTSTHPVVNWNNGFTASGSNTGTYSNTGENKGVNDVATLPANVTSDAAGDFLINNLVAMPQTFRSAGDYIQRVKISYTVTVAGSGTNTYTDITIPLHTFDGTNDTDNTADFKSEWEAGKHITYYITINARAIEFTASISDWGSDSGYHYLVN